MIRCIITDNFYVVKLKGHKKQNGSKDITTERRIVLHLPLVCRTIFWETPSVQFCISASYEHDHSTFTHILTLIKHQKSPRIREHNRIFANIYVKKTQKADMSQIAFTSRWVLTDEWIWLNDFFCFFVQGHARHAGEFSIHVWMNGDLCSRILVPQFIISFQSKYFKIIINYFFIKNSYKKIPTLLLFV